ncbi:efflux RND transporter permease subunit [Salinicoccus roseus]|uniref:efflux RND transporter permease subunit n=1 Tax=Salinicoccus roseus TaxID=45670 RepID=UPI001EF5F2F9|nr:efflux RND transporter permease subunit [Salinicoccus roseus]MCG7331741.1 efflux RND transporter permease subunit [Salinicoccus roseus]
MKLADFSIKRPKFTIVVMIILILLGAVSLTRLPLQLLPNVQPPIAAVATTYQGAGPEEVMEDVTVPLEAELSTVSGLTNISSQSQESSSIILLEFGYDMTIDEVENEIMRTIENASLPDQAGDPSFLEFDITMFPSMTLAVTSGNDSVSEFQGQVDDLIGELENINGVASISKTGSITEEIAVTLDTEALEEYQLSQSDVANIIEANNISIPNATIVDEEAQEAITTRTVSSIDGVEELQNLVLIDLPEDAGTIALDDVADVEIQEQDNDVLTRLNQDDAMQIEMSLSSDANASTVNGEFRSVLEEQLDKEEFENLTVEVLYDEGEYIDIAINSVYLSLISGAILAMVVLFAFLRNLKSPLIIGIAIPFSVITTFALLYFTDISINMMTLGGLALGIGMLVDNAVVVIENIYRHLSMGKTPKQAASDGAKEVAAAITASSMTTAAVFLPVVFVSGLVGQLFTPFAITVVFSLLASLFVALTVVPMIASRILKAPDENKERKRQNKAYMRGLRKLSRWTLAHRMLVLVLTAVILAIGVVGIYIQGIDLLPESDEGTMMVEVEMPQDAILSDTEETIGLIEEKLEEYSEIETYMSTIGSASTMSPVDESNVGNIMATLVGQGERSVTTNEFIEDIESDIENVDPSADISVNPMSQAGTGSNPNTLTLNVADEDSDRLAESETAIIEALEDDSEIEGVTSSRENMIEELQVRVDRAAARANNLQPAEIGSSIYEAANGVAASTVDEGEEFLTINVKYPESILSSVDAFQDIQIANGQGEYVSIGDVAELEEAEMLPLINRDDQRETSELTVSYSSDMSLNEAGTHVESIVEDAEFADETETSIGGDLEMLEDAIPQLALAIALGIIFIYLVMVAQFESFKHPFVVIFTLPLSIIGVMFSLILTNNPLSVIAVVGIILLLGIVVNNSILLVDYINQQKDKGMPVLEAIEKSVQDRFRPIVITALTTALGMVPLAIGIGEGAELIAPMGIVVIGGLISSTFLTLFIIPIIYSYFDSETRKMNKKYMTPDGEIITQKEIDAQKREEEALHSGNEYGYNTETAYPDGSDHDAPKVQEDPDGQETGGSDRDYIEEMERLIDRMKNDRRKE